MISYGTMFIISLLIFCLGFCICGYLMSNRNLRILKRSQEKIEFFEKEIIDIKKEYEEFLKLKEQEIDE